MLLTNLEQDAEDEESRETLLRDINKMRTFFEQARNKLKTHLAQQANKPAQDGLGNATVQFTFGGIWDIIPPSKLNGVVMLDYIWKRIQIDWWEVTNTGPIVGYWNFLSDWVKYLTGRISHKPNLFA